MGLLGEIDDINTRIDILHKMQEIAYNCFDEVLYARDFREDCNCLIYVYQGSLQYNTKNIGIRHFGKQTSTKPSSSPNVKTIPKRNHHIFWKLAHSYIAITIKAQKEQKPFYPCT